MTNFSERIKMAKLKERSMTDDDIRTLDAIVAKTIGRKFVAFKNARLWRWEKEGYLHLEVNFRCRKTRKDKKEK